MTKLKNETQYAWVMDRIEQLLPLVTNDTPEDDPNFIELEILSSLSADYADVHYSLSNLTIENGIVVERKPTRIHKNLPKFRFKFIDGYKKRNSNLCLGSKRHFTKKLITTVKG